MSAIDTLLQLSVDDLSGKEDKLILSIQSPDFFLASLLDWQRDYQERILRDLILRYGANNRLEIPYGGVSLALLSDSPYPWINVQSVHIDEHDYLIYDDPKPNKPKIKAALKDGVRIPGCHLEKRNNMVIQ